MWIDLRPAATGWGIVLLELGDLVKARLDVRDAALDPCAIFTNFTVDP